MNKFMNYNKMWIFATLILFVAVCYRIPGIYADIAHVNENKPEGSTGSTDKGTTSGQDITNISENYPNRNEEDTKIFNKFWEGKKKPQENDKITWGAHNNQKTRLFYYHRAK